MTGLDTNVLVRFFVEDDPVQSDHARRFMKQTCTAESSGYVDFVVLCELIWVLQRCYKVERPGIVQLVKNLLRTRELRLESPRTAWASLAEYERSAADFADCLVARINQEHGCNETVTFDVQAAKVDGMRLLG